MNAPLYSIPQSTQDSVNQKIVAFIKSKGWNPGVYIGKEAKAKCAAIKDFLVRELDYELHQQDSQPLVHSLIERHDKVFSAAQQDKENLRKHWGDSAENVTTGRILDALNKVSLHQMALRFLIETATKGHKRASLRVITQQADILIGLAQAILQTYLVMDHIYYGLWNYGLRIDENLFFQEERIEKAVGGLVDSYSIGGLDTRYHSKVKDAINAAEDIEQFLQFLDPEVKKLLNFGLRDLFRVLAQIAYSPKLFANLFERCYQLPETLLANVISRHLVLNLQTTKNILRLASLNPQALARDPVLVRELEMHPVRYALRPLCAFNSSGNQVYLFGRQSIDHSLRFWTYLVANGRWPLSEASSSIDAVLKRRQDNILHRLADRVREVCKRHFQFVSGANLPPDFYEEVSPGFGSIEAFAIEPDKKVIALFDIIDFIKGEVPKTIREIYKSLFDDQGEGSIYYRRAQAVKQKKAKVLQLLGYQACAAEDWKLLLAIVSQAIYWNSFRFSNGTEIDFIPVEQLDHFIKIKLHSK